ncbi:TerB family tellurite resistance protein [Aquiflexum lacus]|uniref:TerB family tellurite resistance protein n=1 Tax=Aquiflexum lacus TaxID=2483805 RepID=UPI001E620BD4|nr:TerB family tellurite resistance protein [Aquiflexum lacus]
MALYNKLINISLAIGLGAFLICFNPVRTVAQVEEAAQLLLNVEKLAQLQQILRDLERGYTIMNQGLGKVKDLSEGNFNIHRIFLDALMQVSPAVRNYHRVPAIIDYQLRLVREYRNAFDFYRRSGVFDIDEIEYMGRVYNRLFQNSLRNLDDLVMVLTANSLRMGDDERMQSIDRIFSDMEDKLSFLRVFNEGASLLALQRGKEVRENNLLEDLHGLPK